MTCLSVPCTALLTLYFTCTDNLAALYCCAYLAKKTGARLRVMHPEPRPSPHADHICSLLASVRTPNLITQLQEGEGDACLVMFCLRPAPELPIDLCSPKPQAQTREPSLRDSSSNSTYTLPTFASAPQNLKPLSQPITANHRLAPVELEALKACKLPCPPSKQDVMRCFDLIPRAFMKLGPHGSRYVVGGASPRSRHTVLTHSRLLPIFNCLVTRYLGAICPHHKFTTYVLRTGVLDKPHRDTKNAPLPSLIQALRTPNPRTDGLWLHDPLGSVPKVYEGNLLKGSIIPLHEPYLFQPRSVLHAGHVQDPAESLGRLILVAFTTIHGSVLSESTRLELCDLGFRIPDAVDFQCALHGSIPGDFPRLRQLSLQEALRLPSEVVDRHDVVPLRCETIEVSDEDSEGS